jgi:hypothetical protein
VAVIARVGAGMDQRGAVHSDRIPGPRGDRALPQSGWSRPALGGIRLRGIRGDHSNPFRSADRARATSFPVYGITLDDPATAALVSLYYMGYARGQPPSRRHCRHGGSRYEMRDIRGCRRRHRSSGRRYLDQDCNQGDCGNRPFPFSGPDRIRQRRLVELSS